MDVRDQSLKVDKARDQYREAQEELKGSYDKSLKQMKDTYDMKSEKQSKSYANQKTKLEEANLVNNELYTEKTKEAISRGQEDFKNRIRENNTKFEKERTTSKNELSEKLTSLSDSYKKSYDENNRYEDQIKRTMGERYTNANKNYQAEFNKQISNLDAKARKENLENREFDKQERRGLTEKNSGALEELRLNANEEKFKEVSRLRGDSENLRTTMARENQLLKDRQDERVADLIKLKGKESDDGMKNFDELQKNIRQKNIADKERQNTMHVKESKELESKFNEDVRNIQKIATQKIKGGTSVDSLADELKQTKDSYEGRLQMAREELGRNNKLNSEKEENVDLMYRDKLKTTKNTGVEALARSEYEANDTMKKTITENRDKNNAMVDRFKTENGSLKKESDDHLSHVTEQSKNKIKEQRVEFGRVVNTMNDKNMETINSLKDDFSKDKTTSIEKSKKEFNEEKVSLKNEFNRQSNVRDNLYEQKLADMEKQTNRVIENYENRIAQIVRKAEGEVESIKTKEETRKLKETQANKLAFETLVHQNNNEMGQSRERYETIIAKNQALSEQKTNQIVQKYEDQLGRERTNHQKEMTVRLGEAQSQFERLYKGTELEKDTIRNQYEQRIENMKLASLTQENSKKA